MANSWVRCIVTTIYFDRIFYLSKLTERFQTVELGHHDVQEDHFGT